MLIIIISMLLLSLKSPHGELTVKFVLYCIVLNNVSNSQRKTHQIAQIRHFEPLKREKKRYLILSASTKNDNDVLQLTDCLHFNAIALQ